MATDITSEARDGQRSQRAGIRANPHLFSSPAWLGFEAGHRLGSEPDIEKATMGRSFSVNVRMADRTQRRALFAGEGLSKIAIERR